MGNNELDMSDVLQERMRLVVDEEVIESLEEYNGNDFVKIFDMGHPPGTSRAVASSSRVNDPKYQIIYKGWMKTAPSSLCGLYKLTVAIGENYERFFGGPSEIYDF